MNVSERYFGEPCKERRCRVDWGLVDRCYDRLYNRSMTRTSQRRAVANHRRRLGERGMSRYEVRGLADDKELVRTLARRLAKHDPASVRLRAELARQLDEEPPQRGGILAALRRSPLVGADLKLERESGSGRDVDL
jgi:hypothetical protein